MERFNTLFGWIFLAVSVATPFLWFYSFPLEFPWDWMDLSFEGASLIVFIVGYLFVRKWQVPALEIGWGLVSYSFLLDFLCGFAKELERWNIIIEGLLRTGGLLLIATGLYFLRKRRQTELAEVKQAAETIWQQVYHDPLTGLPNRMLFEDRLTLELAHARRDKQGLAVMFLDLDHFKLINDTLGHSVGDQLLQNVAHRLRDALRGTDTVARMGGDEFALLLTRVTHAENVARVTQKILHALKPPFNFGGYDFHITASIGITLYPSDGEDTQTLLKNADTALYRAKEQGRNVYQFYTPAMNAKTLERLTLETNLRRALERKEFVIYYQPRVKINTKRIIGMEALVRWQHPELGLISPVKFIPLAEETGLIIPLGEWVLRTACEQTKAWQEAGFPPLRVGVNLSARQFQQPNLVERVAQVLKETGLHPHYLELEITESAAMQNAEYTLPVLYHLKEMGIHISIDDFGTGYSSLSYLKKFPFHTLKLDQSFIRDLTTDPNDAMIAKVVITLAHGLKLEVVAEGVETQEQLNFLKQLQGDEVQGYLFSKPLPAEEFEELLRQEMERKE
ncbi:MAG TPA: EAL domain-containing protein [Candidatus Limnocylindrales bacterium]|nr:EAL domain-containing protein [Candidatus Limnocylindrales bacterium]